MCPYEQDLALNNPQGLICHITTEPKYLSIIKKFLYNGSSRKSEALSVTEHVVLDKILRITNPWWHQTDFNV